MNDEQMKQELAAMLSSSRGSLVKRLRDGTLPEMAEFILRKTAFMDDSEHESEKYSWLCRIYCVLHGLDDFPKCNHPDCEKKIDKANEFLGEKRGFRPYCSRRCSQTAPDVIRHRAETCMASCGMTTKSKLKSVIEKGMATRAANGSSYEIASEKARLTRYEKNGGKWHAGDFWEKVKSGKARNGHEPGWNNPEQRKKTLSESYGVGNAFNLPCARAASSESIKRKSYDEHIANSLYDEPLFTFEEYAARRDDNQPLRFRCRKCGKVFDSPHRDGHHRKCPECYPKLDGESGKEIELRNFVSSCLRDGETVMTGTRSVIWPKELDVYVPSRKLAVEFDGLFWHCDANSSITRDYHLEKTKACAAAGIRLVHVFEDEWDEKKPIVESRLKNLLGVYGRTVYARQCEVAEVSSKESSAFQDETHLQGHVNASVRLGLYCDGALLALMTFGKCRFDKRHEWEMLRFCSKPGYHLPGAASRLLSHFERKCAPKSVVTYADRRWSDGNLYRKLGFAFVGNSPPNYWYVGNDGIRYSRIEFQKHKLKDKLKIYDESRTEVENMRANGYYRVFDCGNMVFEKEYAHEGL